MNLDPRHKSQDARERAGRAWHSVADSAEWDRLLAKAGGHPLQSALWGDARSAVDGIRDVRAARDNADGTVSLVRMELRKIPFLGWDVGWIPRGPAGLTHVDKALFSEIAETTGCHPLFVVADPWRERAEDAPPAAPADGRPETIWIDLSPGRETLWRSLDKRVRYSVERARKSNVAFGRSRAGEDRAAFFALIEKISDMKQFDLALSKDVVDRLLASPEDAPVSAHLFTAKIEGTLAAAALVVKSGVSIHYIAGGSDRHFARERAGEALQWSIVEWAIGEGARLYDMEGIDRAGNPSTYAFKKKMGGREVAFPGKQYYPLGMIGSALAIVDRLRNRAS